MSRIEALPPRPNEISTEKRMPLSFVPEAGKRFTSPELESIAGHELNHALVAIANGVTVINISLEPMGNSLARTTLGGMVSMETMKVIAAGGGVETHDGCAHGFGSDKSKVDILHHFHGGYSWESAKGRASNILASYSLDVRRKAAEIIAYMKEVSGSRIYDVMRRAQMEVDEEKGIKTEPIIFLLQHQEQEEFESYTVIDELPGNMQRITYVVGEVRKEEFLCGACHGIKYHDKECQQAKLKADSETKSLISKRLPIKAIIFQA